MSTSPLPTPASALGEQACGRLRRRPRQPEAPPPSPAATGKGTTHGGHRDGLEPRAGKGPASPATGLAPSMEAPVVLTQTLELSTGSGVIFIYFLH